MWLVLTHCRILNNLFPLLYVCDVSYKVGSTTMRRLYHIFYTKSEKTMMKRVHETAESHAKLIKSKFDVSLAYSSHSLLESFQSTFFKILWVYFKLISFNITSINFRPHLELRNDLPPDDCCIINVSRFMIKYTRHHYNHFTLSEQRFILFIHQHLNLQNKFFKVSS